MKGYLWGLGSVVLVTLAQLLLKWGVIQLPLTGLSGLNLQFLSIIGCLFVRLRAVCLAMCSRCCAGFLPYAIYRLTELIHY